MRVNNKGEGIMKLIKQKPCGCKAYSSFGLPVEILCKRHLNKVVEEAEETERKRARVKEGR